MPMGNHTTNRPQPPPDTPFDMSAPARPGYRWELRPEAGDHWRIATDRERAARKCRRPGCRNAPAAALRRSRGWYLYCSDHLYGRVIVGGAVMVRRAIRDEPLQHPGSTAAILAALRKLAAADGGEAMRLSPSDARAILKLIEPGETTT